MEQNMSSRCQRLAYTGLNTTAPVSYEVSNNDEQNLSSVRYMH